MRIEDPGSGYAPSVYGPQSDFEAVPHRRLLKMLDGASHAPVTSVADKLTQAGDSLNDIAQTLKSHMSNLDWESEAGDAFREWGHKVASATYTLADYASTAGTQMTDAGHQLSTVTGNMPEVPEGAATTVATYRAHKGIAGPYNDAAVGTPVPAGAATPTESEYQTALSTLNTAHLEAADSMTSLGNVYTSASYHMSNQEQPVFPPLPTKVMPPEPGDRRDSSSMYPAGSDSSIGSSSSTAVHTPGSVTTANTRSTTTDTVVTPRTPTTLDDFSGHQTGGVVMVDPPAIPVRTIAEPTLPVYPTIPGNPGVLGTESGYPNAPGRPGGRVPGEPEFRGRTVISPEVAEGIEGGRLSNPAGGFGSARPRFSSGTVIGEEPAGGSAGVRPGSRAFGGAMAGEESAEHAAATPYGAQGGVSRGMPGSMAGFGSGRSDRGRRKGDRPDWLVEDEETWSSGGPGIVPPVLD